MKYKLKIKLMNFLNIFLNIFNIHIDSSINKKNFIDLINLMKVKDLGFDLIRVGSKNDGGYLIPDIINEIDYCFSPGVGNIYEFEKELRKKNIGLFLIDGSVEKENIKIDKFNFLKKNLSSNDNDKEITLESWINNNLKDNNNNLLLQMDIEGSEYEVINSTSSKYLKFFKIMIIEFHYFEKLTNRLNYNIFLNCIKKILENFEIAHVHPNNCNGTFNLFDEKIPTAIEVTFLRKDLCRKKEAIITLPHKYDQRNITNLPEVKLSKRWYV